MTDAASMSKRTRVDLQANGGRSRRRPERGADAKVGIYYKLALGWRCALVGAAALGMTACATASPSAPAAGNDPAVAASAPGGAVADPTGGDDQARLTRLWKGREQGGVDEFPLGPGDMITLSCPDDDEFNNQYRIGGDGTISLPLVGSVKAAGLTQDQLKQSLQARLGQYLRSPQMTLLVQSFHSREVGVFGAVAKPGVYDLTSSKDTIQDMISLAGGMTTDASPRIEFKPAMPASPGGVRDVSFGAGADPGVAPLTVNDIRNAIVVDTDDPIGREFLAMPARPGDVINVAADGQVLVDGWVNKPGSYSITHEMNVLGAVAAAGGAMYPAKTTAVKLVRKGRAGDGAERIVMVDLEQVSSGAGTDPAVEDGDVIEVPASDVKMVPYSFYEGLTNLIRGGFYYVP